MKLEEKVKIVLEAYPHAHGNNTEIALCFWEYVANARGINVNDWREMKSIAREYPLESITRARRKVVESTEPQRLKEEEMHAEYSGRTL